MWYNKFTSSGVYFLCPLSGRIIFPFEGGKQPISAPAEEVIFSGGADMRVKITLACTECKQRNYVSKKNKKNDPDRIEMMKHCKFCRKHTLHKETK